MKPHSQVTVLAGEMSEHTHVFTCVHTCWYSNTEASPSRVRTVHEGERDSVITGREEEGGREGERETRKRGGEGEREQGREGEGGMLLAHFHSGSYRPLQESSTLRPAPLSQSHWLL